MNQREATVIIIDLVRGIMPEDPNVARALKVLERRAEVLRRRDLRRNVEVPEDLAAEPITVSRREIIDDLRGAVCRPCGRKKRKRESFCGACFDSLDAGVAKALWRSDLYDAAYCRAVRILTPALKSPQASQATKGSQTSGTAARERTGIGEARREAEF
jgi:hypothetical protein